MSVGGELYAYPSNVKVHSKVLPISIRRSLVLQSTRMLERKGLVRAEQLQASAFELVRHVTRAREARSSDSIWCKQSLQI